MHKLKKLLLLDIYFWLDYYFLLVFIIGFTRVGSTDGDVEQGASSSSSSSTISSTATLNNSALTNQIKINSKMDSKINSKNKFEESCHKL